MSFKPKKPLMSNDLMRSFGRVQGRKLRPEQQDLIENFLPKFAITVNEQIIDPHSLFSNKKDKICLEIGFGRGEHVAGYAAQNPDWGCIGCEPFINGVARLLKQLREEKIENVRILNGDARLLLEKLPENSIDKIFVLFPDPWPKSRHYKKRIINAETLTEISRVLKPNGILEVATDHVEYSSWIAQHLDNSPTLKETNVTKGKRETPPADWIRTRYQEKAEEQGRGATFFNFIKVTPNH